jgi:hypothetical protein
MQKKEKLLVKRTSVRRRERYNNLPDTEMTSLENGPIQMNDRKFLSRLDLKERYENWFGR